VIEHANLLLTLGSPHDLLAHEAHPAALAALFVDVAIARRIAGDLGLIAAGNPFVFHAVGDVLAAILNPGVAALDAIGEPQLKVADRAAGPDEEGVPFGGVLLGGFAANTA